MLVLSIVGYSMGIYLLLDLLLVFFIICGVMKDLRKVGETDEY